MKDIHFNILTKAQDLRKVILQGRTSKDPRSDEIITHCTLIDVTRQYFEEVRQAKAVRRTEGLFDLILKSSFTDEKTLLEEAMNQIEAITDSQIGFVHFVSEDQQEIELVTWSTNTIQHHCQASFDEHYPVEKAGIWADCVRNRQPVVVNDYENANRKMGLPEGHSELVRFASVPILFENQVRMIIGVGNSETDYDDYDVETIELFGHELYQLIQLKRANDRIEESEQRFHHLFQKAPVAYQSLDDQGNLKVVNEAWKHLFGVADENEIVGRNIGEFLTPESIQHLSQSFPAFLQTGRVSNELFEINCPDGTTRDVEVTGRTSLAPVEGGVRTHCMLVDVTEKLRTERALKLASKVFESSGEGLMVTDAEQKIVTINNAFTDILGYSEEEVKGKTPRILHSGRHDDVFYQEMWQQIRETGKWQGEIWNRHKNGLIIPEWITISEVRGEKGDIENYVGIFADISKLKESQAELSFLENFDPMTHLPNRQKFLSQLQYALTHSKRTQKSFAVLMIDLDRFKDVNDSFGHLIGDEVLINLAQRFRENLCEMDTIARFSGDEFVVLIEDLLHEEDAARVARTMIECAEKTLKLSNDQEINLGCSVGISLFPEHSESPEELLQQADAALYLAKKQGRGSYEYYTSEMTVKAQERIAIETLLKRAVPQGELRVFFQPQVHTQSGQLKGAEALVRWQHPELGLVSPMTFIPIAEESGLISEIGEWVLFETCRFA